MYLIIFFIILFLLSSCTTKINYGYFEMYANAIFKERINVDEEFIRSSDYSFIKVRYKRNEATLVLASAKDGVMEWVGADFVTIKTKNGIIIETSGLPSNISYFPKDISYQLTKINNFSDFYLYLYIDNPELIHTRIDFKLADKELNQINHGGLKKLTEKIIYEKNSDSIGWKVNDILYFKDGRVIKSVQELSPLTGKIYLEFYYK